LQIKKSESGLFSSERHKTHWRSGVLCHAARVAYDPKSWPLQLDNKKSESGRIQKQIKRAVAMTALAKLFIVVL